MTAPLSPSWLDELSEFLAIPSVSADPRSGPLDIVCVLRPNERMLVETFPLGVAAARATYRALATLWW